VNVLWGFLNLVVAYALLCHVGDFRLHDTVEVVFAGAGLLAISLFAARHFGGLHGSFNPDRS
jgi:hypothetical protein